MNNRDLLSTDPILMPPLDMTGVIVIDLAEIASGQSDPTQRFFLTQLLDTHKNQMHFLASFPIYIRKKADENTILSFRDADIHSFVVTYVPKPRPDSALLDFSTEILYIQKSTTTPRHFELTRDVDLTTITDPPITHYKCPIPVLDSIDLVIHNIWKRENTRIDISGISESIPEHIPIDKINHTLLPLFDKEKLYNKICSQYGHKYAIRNELYHIKDYPSTSGWIRLVGGNILLLPPDTSGISRYLIYSPISHYSFRTDFYRVLGEITYQNKKWHINAVDKPKLIKTEHQQLWTETDEAKYAMLIEHIYPLFPELDCNVIIDRANPDDIVIYTTMNQIDAPDLVDLFNEDMSQERLNKLIYTLLLGVKDKLHSQGVVHLDIKPDNIKVIYNKVTDDWSIIFLDVEDAVKIGCLKHKKDKKRPFGSVPYSAPEQIISYKADVYAMGITILSLVTKALSPKQKEMIAVQLESVDEPLKTLLTHMTLEDPKQRWDSYEACEYMHKHVLRDVCPARPRRRLSKQDQSTILKDSSSSDPKHLTRFFHSSSQVITPISSTVQARTLPRPKIDKLAASRDQHDQRDQQPVQHGQRRTLSRDTLIKRKSTEIPPLQFGMSPTHPVLNKPPSVQGTKLIVRRKKLNSSSSNSDVSGSSSHNQQDTRSLLISAPVKFK